MMNNCELISSSVHTQRETSRGTKRPHLSSSSQASRRPDRPTLLDTEDESRSPRRMRMSPTHPYGGGSVAGLNLLATEAQNAAAPRPLHVYGAPLPLQPQSQPRTLPLPLQRRHQQQQQQQQRRKTQGSPPLLVHRPGKRTVYVQDVVFKLLVTSQLDT